MKKPTTVAEYIAGFPKETQTALKKIRAIVKKNVPGTEETISYGIAMFKLNGRMLLYFAGFKNHVSIYPVPRNEKSFEKDFAKYYTSGKGTIQFPLDEPIPATLVTKIVKYMLNKNKERAALAKTKKTSAKKTTTTTAKSAPSIKRIKNHIHYHKDGSVWAKGKLNGNTMEGYWEWYRKDGVILRSGHFKKGKQVGEWITYDKTGKPYKVTKIKK